MIEIMSLVIVLIALPFVVYMSVKLGTYAFYRGKQLFERENENGKRGTKTGISSSQGRDA
jgi:hypothetical protein